MSKQLEPSKCIMNQKRLAELEAQLKAEREKREYAEATIARALDQIENMYDVTPVAQDNGGFPSKLENYIHQTWKRDPKVSDLRAKLDEAENVLLRHGFGKSADQNWWVPPVNIEAGKWFRRFAIAEDRAKKAEAEVARLKDVIRWALGEVGEFPPRQEAEGTYYWRRALRERYLRTTTNKEKP
jgi:hypothetical protein